MSDEHNPNRTVFRPSPLQGLRSPGPGQPPPPKPDPLAGTEAVTAPTLPDDDIPLPQTPAATRNVMMAKAAPLLALAASVRSGRARIEPPKLHAQAVQAITAFDQAVVAAGYPDEQRQRGKYGLCATIDDIAQNLPGTDGAEWARHSLVVQFFQEAIGGDRFWQLVDDMLARPAQYADLIELYHACLAAGFEGRMRVAPDGKRRLHEIMTSLYAALGHVRTLSPTELSPHWRGEPTPPRRVGFWSILAVVGGAALGLLFVVYIVLRLMLLETGRPAMDALRGINPDEPLRLSRLAPPPPAPTSGQLQTLETFLAPEIAQHLVVVEQDGSTVRVRTTVGQLFASGSDELEASAKPLFNRIAAAIETQPGNVKVEGYTDSDRVKTLTFPDNIALSKARADAVAAIIKSKLSNPGRVSAEGFGDGSPIAPNTTPQGKSLNRRVEVVVPRTT
ncbi:MAG: type VI secretion system protein TssL, long form [Caulobacteraceae bacterium]